MVGSGVAEWQGRGTDGVYVWKAGGFVARGEVPPKVGIFGGGP